MDGARIDLGELAARVAAIAGMARDEVLGSGAALAAAAMRVGPRTNPAIALHTSGELGLRDEICAADCFRRFQPLTHPFAMPPWFTARSHEALMSPVRLLAVPGGHLLHLAHAPVVLTAAGDAVVQDFSGRFAPLVNHTELDIPAILRRALPVRGAVFVLGDEVAPLNYCHWLLDALPRLYALQRRRPARDVRIAVTPLTAAFQRETLHRCGFDDDRIIQLSPLSALRADELLVTSDLPDPPHPAFKAAPWAIRFLCRHLGKVHATPARRDGRRLYISRGDAGGRRVVNESALLRALRPLGFEAVRLDGMSVQEQAALFAEAAFIVGPHGAGLTNAVFAPQETRLLELFPPTYGMASYYLLAAGARLRYEYLIAPEVARGSRAQLDDMRVNTTAVVAKCRDMLS